MMVRQQTDLAMVFMFGDYEMEGTCRDRDYQRLYFAKRFMNKLVFQYIIFSRSTSECGQWIS